MSDRSGASVPANFSSVASALISMKMPDGICNWYLTITSTHFCIVPAKFISSSGMPAYCIISWWISNFISSSCSKNFLPHNTSRARDIRSLSRRAKPIAKSARKFMSRGVSAPTMPKSMNATTLPGRMKMLPGCGSAWKKPWRRIIVSSALAPFTAIWCVSSPASRRACGVSGVMPSTFSITISFLELYFV